jgi:predicted alpha/beta hydrolase
LLSPWTLGQHLEGLAGVPLGHSLTKTLIGAGVLGLPATLWSEWSKWRRKKVVYVMSHASDGVTGPEPPGVG